MKNILKKYDLTKCFFCFYFVAIILILIITLVMEKPSAYETYNMGVHADENYELLDGQVLESVFSINRDHPLGVTLNSYRKNGIQLTDEILYVDVLNEDTKELIQQNQIDLVREVDEKNIYIPFEQELTAGTRIRLRLHSEGFEEKGPLLALSDTTEYGNLTKENGALLTQYLCASLWYPKTSDNYLKPIIYFAAEFIIGIALIVMHRKGGIALTTPKEKAGRRKSDRKTSWIKTLAGILCLWCGLIIFFDYVYTYSIEEAISKKDIQVVSDLEETTSAVSVQALDGYSNSWNMMLKEGSIYTQVFTAQEDDLSGLGLNISASGSEIGENTVLRIRLYDKKKNVLLQEQGYKLSELDKVSEYISAKSKPNEKTISSQYLEFDFPQVIQDSENQIYKLEFWIESTEGMDYFVTVTDGAGYSLQQDSQRTYTQLCMLSLHSAGFFLTKLFFCLVAIALVMLTALFIWICRAGVKAETLFVICAVILGVVYMFLIPPYCVPDERTHIDSAYHLSNDIMGLDEEVEPSRIYKRSCDILPEMEPTMDITTERYKDLYGLLGKNVESDDLMVTYADNAVANVNFVSYLPQALGFTAARLLDLNHFSLVMMGRFLNMLFSVLLMYIGIRKLPFGKTVLCILGLLPMLLQQIASCSYDGAIIGASYIFIGYSLAFMYKEETGIIDIMIMLFSGGYLASCKGGVYLPVLGILLLIPFVKQKVNLKWFTGIILLYVPMGMIFLAQFATRILGIFSRSQGGSYRSGTTLELYSLAYFLESPKELIRLVQNTFFIRGDLLLQEVLGSRLGKLNISIPWFVLIGFIIILVLAAAKKTGEKTYLTGIHRLYIGVLCLASIGLVMASMLFAWTEVGKNYIEGLQGRYFLPFVGLLILTLRNDVLTIKNKRSDILIWCTVILDVIVAGCLLLAVF